MHSEHLNTCTCFNFALADTHTVCLPVKQNNYAKHTHTHTLTRMHPCQHKFTHAHKCMHTCTCINSQMYITCMHTHTHTHTHTQTHTHTHSLSLTHTHTHITHACMDTHIHTNTYKSGVQINFLLHRPAKPITR